MLPKDYRIKRNRFGIVLKKGRRFKFSGYSLITFGNRAGHPRISLVVKSGVIKDAVKRNKQRRKILGLIEAEIRNSSRPIDIILLTYRIIESQQETGQLKDAVLKQL